MPTGAKNNQWKKVAHVRKASNDEEEEDTNLTENSANDLPLHRLQEGDNLAYVRERRLQQQEQANESVNSTVHEQHDSSSEETEYPKVKKRRRITLKRKWTSLEKDEVAKHFTNEIINRRLPGKSAINDFLQKTRINHG